MTEPETTTTNEMTALVQEFNGLRAEIVARTSAQHTLLNLHVTIIGTILGFALSAAASPLILLVVPLVSISTGFLYLHHHVDIHKAGIYIDDQLRPVAEQLSGGRPVWQWERLCHRSTWRHPLSATIMWSPLVVLFIIAPLFASIYVASVVNSALLWTAWGAGVGAELLLIVVGAAVANPRRGTS